MKCFVRWERKRSRNMAEMIPDQLPRRTSRGEERLFDVLQRLPDDYIVYCTSQSLKIVILTLSLFVPIWA